MEFVKLYALVLLLLAPCAVTGLAMSWVPRPVIGAAALAILAVAIHRHRNRSLV
jgi:hypothetical protein